jgi:hypothetical protein
MSNQDFGLLSGFDPRSRRDSQIERELQQIRARAMTMTIKMGIKFNIVTNDHCNLTMFHTQQQLF